MKIELVVSTYQKPAYLALALASLNQQRCKPHSVCIADDGSDHRTAKVVAAFAKTKTVPIRHVWHEDSGFRKTRILNEAVRSSEADYVIFIDDDCLMHRGFVARHVQMAKRGQFLTGSVIRLPAKLSEQILHEGHIRLTNRLRPHGWQPRNMSERLKSMPLPAPVMGWLDRLSPVRCNWAGGNASTFREHILAVNGFDNRMAYGGEDKEFGARLINFGIKGRHLRYSAPLYHLEHPRGYVDPTTVQFNRDIILNSRATGRTRCEDGINT